MVVAVNQGCIRLWNKKREKLKSENGFNLVALAAKTWWRKAKNKNLKTVAAQVVKGNLGRRKRS
jgi:hypothetical protein